MHTRAFANHLIPLAGLACMLAIAGCGSSSKSTNSSASAAAGQGLQYSQCMRAHGVPNFPDPSGSGGGIQIKIGSGVNPSSPAFEAAQNACQKLLPGGGPTSGHPSEQVKQQMLGISTCMRAHGISGFPDPTTGQPPAPGSGYSIVLGRNGVFLAVPSSVNVASPAFKQAATACGFGGPGKAQASAAG